MEDTFVFLGGTCGKNVWRHDFIDQLVAGGIPKECIFNPVLPEGVSWGGEAQAAEDAAKENAKFTLFYLGDAKTGVVDAISIFSMLQLVVDLYRHGNVHAFFDFEQVPGHAEKVLKKLAKDIETRFPGQLVSDLPALADIVQQAFMSDHNASFFAAGTCGNNTWRGTMSRMLRERGVSLDRFVDPRVDDYGDGARYFERYVRMLSTNIVYYIGDPMMVKQSTTDVSAYSGVETLMGLFDTPDRTIVVMDADSFDGYDLDSIRALAAELEGCTIFPDLDRAAKRLVHEYQSH